MALRIAVAGAGLIGRAHIQRIVDAPGAELAAIVDPQPAGRDLAGAHGVPHYAALEPMLDDLRPDGVILATPNRLHVEGALATVARGIATLVEKPVAEDMASALRLADAAEAAGVPVLVGHHHRHSLLMREAKAIIASGALGRIVAVNALAWLRKPDSGYFDGAGAWRREPGGGVVLINLIHLIDDLRNLCGEIAEVRALTSSAVRGFEVEDTAAAMLVFESGALGTVSLSDSAVGPWSWELTAGENKAYPHTDEACYLISGTTGALSVPRLEFWNYSGEAHWFRPIESRRRRMPEADPLTLQLEHFCAVIRREAPPAIDARSAARSLEATLEVQRGERVSAATGR